MLVGIDGRGAVWYRGTGIGTYTYQLLKHLKEREEGQTYRIFWPGEEYLSLNISDQEDFRQVEAKENYWEEVFLPKAIGREAIDIYHVPQNGIGLPREKKCLQVVTIHDLIPYVYPETVGRKYLQNFLEEMPRIMESSDHIITVSECSKRDIQYIFDYPAEKISVIPEAPEPMYRMLSLDAAKDFLRQKYGISGNFILYLGGFGPRKNVRGLIVAFALALKEMKEPCRLVLPGRWQKESDPLEHMLHALNIADKVILPGYVAVDHLPYFYRAAQLFVYPSFYEGFGLPPLEAMACGTPVIASNTSSIPEVVGDGACLVNPFDTVSMAEHIYRLLNDEEARLELAEKGRQQVKKYSWAKTAAYTARVYEKMMKEKK